MHDLRVGCLGIKHAQQQESGVVADADAVVVDGGEVDQIGRAHV